jgi:hypothetical protein
MSYQKVKTQQCKEREKDFSDYCPAKRRVHFFGNEVLPKMCGKSNAGRKSRKGLIA